MPWPTWDQAAIAAAVSAVVWLLLRTWAQARTTRAGHALEPVAQEFALVASLYSVWRLARMLPIASTDGALDRAHDLARLEAWLHLPSELSLERFVLDHRTVGAATTWFYATVHVPALIAFLVWMFWRHRDVYPHWRNGLVLTTLGCLVIRFVRVAPPRFLTDLGYTDPTHHHLGPSVYDADVARGLSDQFAAMPSIHVGWAAVVSFGIVAASRSRWRWLALLHVVVTMLVVAATANHWWLDGVVAIMLLAGGLALDTVVRRRRAGRPRGTPVVVDQPVAGDLVPSAD